MPRTNLLLAISALVVALFFGSFQEKVKISVNNIIKYGQTIPSYNNLPKAEREKKITQIITDTPRGFYSHPSSISMLYGLTIPEMKKLKWVNTFLFIIVHLVLNSLILFFLFKDSTLLKILGGSYVLFALLAIVIYAVGKLTGFSQPGYNVARKIVGALQSQVPIMLFVSGYYLLKKQLR